MNDTKTLSGAEILALLEKIREQWIVYADYENGETTMNVRIAVAALIAENEALRAAYMKARNSAAGYSNYCDDSANARRCERELDEAEKIYRTIDAARASTREAEGVQ